jgi:Fic family protein
VRTWKVRFDLRIANDAPELVRAVAQADALAGVIRGLPIPPYLREHLNKLNIRRAVRGTTGIEGAEVTEEEVERILQAPPDRSVLPPSRSREEQEVRNAEKVAAYISASLRGNAAIPLTHSVIAEIHRLTTEGISYEHNEPGVYRSHAVDVGNYKPPRTRDEIVELMRQFIEWLLGPRAAALAPPVKAIAAHFYFVSIHPFGDGNGRTARAIESFLLYQARINALGFYSLSNFYYMNREAYIEHLDRARFSAGADLTEFISFAMQGLVVELEEVHREVLRAMSAVAFRDYAHHELMRVGKRGSKAGERMYQLLLGIGDPVSISAIRDGAHPLGRLYRRLNPITLSRDIKFLADLHLVIVEEGTVRANLDLMTHFTS